MILDTTPPTFASAEPAGQTTPPLLIAFHRDYSSVESEINDYRPAADAGWRVVMPQSVQLLSPSQFWWGDWDIATKQVARDYQYLLKKSPFDTNRIVTVGMGEGGTVAFWAATSRTIPACGVILFSQSSLDFPQVEQSLQGNAHLRIYLLSNQGDNSLKGFTYFLRAKGVTYAYEEYEGAAYEFPSDFDVRLKRALDFITEPLDI